MKHISLIILGLILSFGLSAQVLVDGVNVNTLAKTDYLEVETHELLTEPNSYPTMTVHIDYGQKEKKGHLQAISGTDGVAIKFTSALNILNFISQNGWVLETQNVIKDDKKGIVHYFLCRRRK